MNSAENMPVWLAWVIAIAGTAVLAAVLFRMAPPVRRRKIMTQRVLPGLGLFLVVAGIARPSSGQLVLAGGGLAVFALSLFWMGKLPADMPLADDPSIRQHPEYRRFARRGRIAGAAAIALEIAWIARWAAPVLSWVRDPPS